jgi:hypothetical protein
VAAGRREWLKDWGPRKGSQHMMTSQCSLPCICTRVISKITPYLRQRKPFQSNETFYILKNQDPLWPPYRGSLLAPIQPIWIWIWISFTLTHPFSGYAGYILVSSKSNIQFVVLRLHESGPLSSGVRAVWFCVSIPESPRLLCKV